MPEKPLARINRLTIAVTVFTAIIVIGLLTIGKPKFKYKISNEEMLSQILAEDYFVSPEAAKEMLADGNVKFVDLRNKYDFNIGHIKDALNIPTHNLLKEENLDIFEDASLTYVLYGQEQLDANGPWMVLKQMGYDNFKILQGGYIGYLTGEGIADGDMAMFDYDTILQAAIKEIADLQKASEAPPAQKRVAKKKVRVIPKKVVKEVEEEEGC